MQNRRGVPIKLLWYAILIATVVTALLRLSGLGITPQSPAIAKPRASIPVVEEAKTATIEKIATRESYLTGEIACFAAFGLGITCLDDVPHKRGESGWTSFNQHDSSLGSDLILDMAVCPDNRILIAHFSGISAFDGQTWAEYKQEWTTMPSAIACDAQGGIWVTDHKAVSYFDGQSWVTTSYKQLVRRDNPTNQVKNVAIAPDGQVWVATSHTIATTLDGQAWTIYEPGQGIEQQYFLYRVAVNHLGEVWALYRDGILHFDGRNWTNHEPPDFIFPQTFTVDDDGNVWVGTLRNGIKRFNGQNWETYNTENSELMSNHVSSLTVDGQNRVWAGTRWGLSVFDGRNWITYQMDNAELVGNDIRHLAVIGDGPVLPETNDKENGQLSGQLLKPNKEPITDATVELCAPYSRPIYTQNSCENKPLILQTTTDADGNFLITDIPVGHVSMVIKIGEDKSIELEDKFRFDKISINAGEETDLSTVIIDW